MRSFDSVASHIELAILSRMFRITEHAQLDVVEYLLQPFLCRNKFKLARSAFSPGYGYNASQSSNLLRFFNFQNNSS